MKFSKEKLQAMKMPMPKPKSEELDLDMGAESEIPESEASPLMDASDEDIIAEFRKRGLSLDDEPASSEEVAEESESIL